VADRIPEYLEQLRARFPDYEVDAKAIANIGMKINFHESPELHTAAVVNQCRVAWETMNSIHCLAGYDYGLGAMGLCRNLFELVVGTIFLIENPSTLQDFIDFGKTVAYEVTEALGAESKFLSAFKQQTDYDRLKKHFGREKWHRKNIKELVEAVGMQRLYGSFYKEASSIAHGDSFITLGFHGGRWQLSGDVHRWSHYCETSVIFSLLLMVNLYHSAIHNLKLPFVSDIDVVISRLRQKGMM
jgi:hypothetical protein